jgi:endogenous inhibitor of DNA gyrase (YacG/DUF329 family)
MSINQIQKECAICGKPFVPKTVNSMYCSKNCGEAAYRKKKALEKKEAEQKAVAEKISADRLYIFLFRKQSLYLALPKARSIDLFAKDKSLQSI